MFPISLPRFISSLFLVVTLGLATSACGPRHVVYADQHSALPHAASGAHVRAALLSALIGRRHQVLGESVAQGLSDAGAVEADMRIGRGSAHVRFDYDHGGVSATLLGSRNLDEQVVEGQRVLSHRYERYLQEFLRVVSAQIAEYEPAPAPAVGVATSPNVTPDHLRAAAARAFESEGFTLEAAQDGELVGRRSVRGRGEALVRVRVSGTSWEVSLVESAGFADAAGRVYVNRHVGRLVSRLADRVRREAVAMERESHARAVQIAHAQRPVVLGVGVGGAVGATCADLVRAYGHSEFDTNNCTPGADLTCVDAVLARGHRPWDIRNCEDVDGLCAIRQLDEGSNPFSIRSRCRRPR